MDIVFAQYIADFNKRNILPKKDIDRDMGVHRPHLATEAQWNTLHQVLYMTADSKNYRQFLPISPPLANPKPLLFLSKKDEFYIDVIEVPAQGASGALYSNSVSLQGDVNISWRVDSLIENGLHPNSRCGKES